LVFFQVSAGVRDATVAPSAGLLALMPVLSTIGVRKLRTDHAVQSVSVAAVVTVVVRTRQK
jgi:hypothetical protein